MLEPIKHILKAKKIILASGSPRRKEIFEKNIVTYFIITIFFECFNGYNIVFFT